jgi:hypothetical protein
MESLCRQLQPANGWELIVFEEEHDEALGRELFESYGGRLRDAGCERLVYMSCADKVPLPQKWVKIAKKSSRQSTAFLMCAADNYYHKWMLQDTEAAIKEADWCIMTKGFFYDFNLDETFYYHYNGIVGLHMAARTDVVRHFEKSDLDRGIDSWFSQQMLKQSHDRGLLLRCFIDGSEHYKGTVCTNGYNNISSGRVNLLREYKHPFYKTEVKLSDIVPEDIYNKMICLKSQL